MFLFCYFLHIGIKKNHTFYNHNYFIIFFEYIFNEVHAFNILIIILIMTIHKLKLYKKKLGF
jgi:hypothetical protein